MSNDENIIILSVVKFKLIYESDVINISILLKNAHRGFYHDSDDIYMVDTRNIYIYET